MLPASKIWVPNLRVYQYSSLVDEIDYSKEDAKINYKEYGSFNEKPIGYRLSYSTSSETH